MAQWEDKITLSVSVECKSDDRTVIAEAIEEAVFQVVSSWEKGSIGSVEVRVVG